MGRTSLYGVNKSELCDEELQNGSYQEWCNLLNSNPVLVARDKVSC